jgi:TetR/AcrR family transcriptional repressor of nem operon
VDALGDEHTALELHLTCRHPDQTSGVNSPGRQRPAERSGRLAGGSPDDVVERRRETGSWPSRARSVILYPVPRPQNPHVRASLLAAGQRLMHSRGFNGSGVKDFTEAAGVPKGSFYNYFASKEAFAVAVLEDYWLSIERQYGPILQDPRLAPVDRVVQQFRAMADDNEARNFALGCLLGNLALELADSSAEIRRTLRTLLGRWERSLADCLREAQDRGDLASEQDPDDLAAALIEAWEGAVMRGKIEQGRRAYQRFESVVVPRLVGMAVLSPSS